MPPPRKGFEHFGSVLFVKGLAENFSANRHDGVRGDYHLAAVLRINFLRLLLCKKPHSVLGRGSFGDILLALCGNYLKIVRYQSQKLAAAG